jgi:hypothetical protein
VRIRYDVTVDDLLAFALYQSGRSLRRRGAGGIVWGVAAMLGLIAVTTTLMGKEAAMVMLPLAVVPIFFILGMLFKVGFWPNTRRTLRRLHEESLPTGATGPHEMELVEDGLVERTPYSERRTPLQGVQRISSDGERTFIYIGPAMAYVIPNRAVSEGDLEAFTEAVRVRVSENLAEQRAASDRPRD